MKIESVSGARRMSGGWWILFLLLFLIPSNLFAHGVEGEVDGGDWWLRWTWQPLVLGNVGLAGLLYWIGVRRTWERAGTGRVVKRRQAGAFVAGLLVLLVALVSPLDAISDELSSAHMVQHMLLMNVAAPLLVLGAPGLAILPALPSGWRRPAGRVLRWLDGPASRSYVVWQPVLLWAFYAAALWVWHLPVLYEAALRNELFHDFQHFTFLAVSCLFWRVLLDPVSRLRLGRAAGVLYLFTTSLHATVLGVFMALAPRVWYTEYAGRTVLWNLTPLQDQQLAGLIMWMPACMVYAVIAAVLFAFWLQAPDSETAVGERRVV